MLPVHQLGVLLNNTSYPIFLDPSAVLQAANSDSQPPTHSFNQSDSQHASQPTSQPVRLPARQPPTRLHVSLWPVLQPQTQHQLEEAALPLIDFELIESLFFHLSRHCLKYQFTRTTLSFFLS